jgi:hypothetical protein
MHFFERLRTMHLPTKSECIELRDACAAIGEKPILTREESYIAVWGPAHFEKIWHRDPEPHAQSLQRKWPRWRP